MKLTADHISFQYKGGDRPIWQDFCFEMTSREVAGLMAPSGFGKTTLCQILAGYQKPDRGRVLLDGKPLPQKGYCPVQMIWQHPEKSVNPRLRMREVIGEGNKVESRILKALGIRSEWMDRYPQELSGGELQRFCIARVLGEGTRFLLADEITAMLDLVTQKQIWQFLLKECQSREIGILAVSHAPGLLHEICTRQIKLQL